MKLGQQRALSNNQELEIFNLLTQRRPFHLKFKLPYRRSKVFLWNRELVMKIIEIKFCLKLTNNGLAKYLSRWGFPKIDRRTSRQSQCEKTIQIWLNSNLQNLIEKSISENAVIYWLGNISYIEMHPGLGAVRKFTYIPLTSHQGRLHWLTVKGKFSQARQIMFLKSLIGQNYKKVFLIRHSFTHFNTEEVREWIRLNSKAIELFPC